MDSNMGGDVIALDGRGAAASPLTRQVEIVRRLSPDMAFADVFLMNFVSVVIEAWLLSREVELT